MYKSKLILLLLLINLQGFSQSKNKGCGTVIYQQTTNFDFEYQEVYKMTFNTDWSYYEEIKIKTSKTTNKTISSEIGVTTAQIKGRKNTTPKYYYNSRKEFYFRDNFADNILLVKELDLPWKWNLKDGTKKIGNFNCQKATITFRGRNYTAWYTNEIPVSFGPWKFQGLPGLILEVYDEDTIFHIYASSVEYNKNSNCNLTINNKELINAININEYLDKIEKINDEIFAQMSSRQTKGSKPLKRDKNCLECKQSIEIFNEKS